METYYEREQEFRGNVCGVEINSQETFYVLAELIEETDLGRLLKGADENDGKLFIKERHRGFHMTLKWDRPLGRAITLPEGSNRRTGFSISSMRKLK